MSANYETEQKSLIKEVAETEKLITDSELNKVDLKYDESLVSGYDAKEVSIEEIIESIGLSLEYQYIRNNGRSEVHQI